MQQFLCYTNDILPFTLEPCDTCKHIKRTTEEEAKASMTTRESKWRQRKRFEEASSHYH
jgi:hypothetical protein